MQATGSATTRVNSFTKNTSSFYTGKILRMFTRWLQEVMEYIEANQRHFAGLHRDRDNDLSFDDLETPGRIPKVIHKTRSGARFPCRQDSIVNLIIALVKDIFSLTNRITT
jgi:hypothetical protein